MPTPLPITHPMSGERLSPFTVAFLLALATGNVEEVRACLAHDPRLAHQSFTTVVGTTPLMMAAEKGDLRMVDAVLPHSEATAINSAGMTALMLAAQGGHLDVVQRLMTVSHLTAQDQRQATALSLAVFHGQTGAVALLQGPTEALLRPEDPSWSTTYWAGIHVNNVAIVDRCLTASNVSVHDRDEEGRTGLHLAVLRGHPTMVAHLLAHGANPNLLWKGSTPLLLAMEHDEVDLVHTLVPCTDLLVRNSQGEDAMAVATGERFGNASLVKAIATHVPLERLVGWLATPDEHPSWTVDEDIVAHLARTVVARETQALHAVQASLNRPPRSSEDRARL